MYARSAGGSAASAWDSSAAVVATTSAGSAYLSIEFVKNGIGLTVAMVAVWAVLVALEVWTPRRAAVAAAADRRARPLTHKMAAGLVVVLCAPAAIAEGGGRGVTLTPPGAWWPSPVASSRSRCWSGWLWPQRCSCRLSISATIGRRDPRRPPRRWDLAGAGATTPDRSGYEPGCSAAAVATVALVALGLGSSAQFVGSRCRSRLAARALAVAAAALALVIAIPWLAVDDAQGLAMRLRVAAFVPLAITAAVAGRGVLAAVRDRGRDLALAAVAAIVVVSVAVAFPGGRSEGEVVTHPALASAVMSLDGLVPDGDVVVVPERHIAFMVAWYTGADVSLQPDVVPRDRRRRLLPLAFIGEKSPLDQALLDARKEPLLDPPIGLHARHPDGLVLVTEPTWSGCWRGVARSGAAAGTSRGGRRFRGHLVTRAACKTSRCGRLGSGARLDRGLGVRHLPPQPPPDPARIARCRGYCGALLVDTAA